LPAVVASPSRVATVEMSAAKRPRVGTTTSERRKVSVIGSSAVHIGNGLLSSIPAEIVAKVKASRFVIVSDANVWSLYGKQLVDAFLALGNFAMPGTSPLVGSYGQSPQTAGVLTAGKKLLITYQIPVGEVSKSREVKDAIEDFMLAHKCNRDTCMFALGGGVTGDLVGYVAATYMRGVPFVQIPTSTMAMIDSSVGGKTAINVPAGKNLIGAFYQPIDVYADLDLLKSLGKREIVEGICEAIKMGCIHKPKLFELLEAHPEEVIALEPSLINEVIYQSVLGKAEVVAADEREAGVRATLNWGHTVGHGIEALKSPAMMHGECVAIGCVVEGELALRMGYDTLTREKLERVAKCFASYGLPIHMPSGLDEETMFKKIGMDKKNVGNSIRCTIVTDIGVSIPDPQPCEAKLIAQIIAESAAAGAELPEWQPLEGNHDKTSSGEAGGFMGGH